MNNIIIKNTIQLISEAACSNHGCRLYLLEKRGMATNGGCHCLRELPHRKQIAVQETLRLVKDIAKENKKINKLIMKEVKENIDLREKERKLKKILSESFNQEKDQFIINTEVLRNMVPELFEE